MIPFFSLFGRTVGSYGVCAVLGLLVCGFWAVKLGRQHGIPSYVILQALVAAGVGLLLGGHLLYGLLHLSELFSPPALTLSALSRGFGGSVYYGGLLGAWLGVAWYARRFVPMEQDRLVDCFALFTPLFHAFGRVGCFLGGCCYGIPCRFGITVTENPLIPEVNDIARFPVQLLEAGCELALFFFLLWLFYSQRQAGRLIFCYLAPYALLRFGLEFLRGDIARGVWLGISTSQWLSIPLFLFALWRFVKKNTPVVPS